MFITVTTATGERDINMDLVREVVPSDDGAVILFGPHDFRFVRETPAEIRERRLVGLQIESAYAGRAGR